MKLACSFVFLAALCASATLHAQSLAPPDWDAGLRQAAAPDLNPDPRIVEIELARTARRGGDRGDACPGVDLQRRPSGPAHPHTCRRSAHRAFHQRAAAADDGALARCAGADRDGRRARAFRSPKSSRGESFTYDFVVRDAGLYWYHPHVMSAAQVGFGLYGALLVEDPGDGVGIADELTLVLSDIGFDKKGRLESPDSGGSAGMVFGREGAYLLVNGKSSRPVLARAPARRSAGASSTPPRAGSSTSIWTDSRS